MANLSLKDLHGKKLVQYLGLKANHTSKSGFMFEVFKSFVCMGAFESDVPYMLNKHAHLLCFWRTSMQHELFLLQ